MKLTPKFQKLTYKSIVGYGLIILLLLLVAVPALANTTPGRSFLDFSFNSKTGYTLRSARPLSPGINVNHLDPGQENWYVYNRASFTEAGADIISLALRYQSEAVISTAEANFQILAEIPSTPNNPAAVMPETVGAGSLSPVGRPGLTETVWSGQVGERSDYYVRVFNNSPFKLEYTLEAKAETSAVTGAIPAGLNSLINSNEALSARQMAWSLTAQAVDNMTAVQAAQWMQEAQAVGWLVTAGTLSDQVANPGDANPQTLWRLTAQAIEGQDAQTAAQWLIQADALGWLTIPPGTLKNPNEETLQLDNSGGDEGGGSSSEPEPVPAPPDEPEKDYIPVNIYPNNPLDFNFHEVNSGRLAPDGEHWYKLQRDDLDEDLIENLDLTMFFTPSQGFLSNKVNFEIFPAGQYHIWERGDADYMENMGAGMWVSRDKDPLTSERLWAGSLVDGDTYLIKIKNGSPEVVDYYLFPNDVWNAELGNPTLHKGDASHGRVPFTAPVTRSTGPVEPGSGPPEAVELKVGTTTGELEAGEEMWYKFVYSDPGNDESADQDFIFYMTNTPLDDIRARHADFEIYPGSQLHLWVRGTVDELDPLGASAPATFAQLDDERSLQVLWSGQLKKEHVYYVKVYNHDIGPLEYEFKIKTQ